MDLPSQFLVYSSSSLDVAMAMEHADDLGHVHVNQTIILKIARFFALILLAQRMLSATQGDLAPVRPTIMDHTVASVATLVVDMVNVIRIEIVSAKREFLD